jgi:CRISPR-associated helicase Cas3
MMTTTVEWESLPRYVMPGIGMKLLPHQVAMESRWGSLTEVVLTAGTGCGKTLAAFLPAIRRGESVIAAYPTNALLQDQAESIMGLVGQVGKTAHILSAEDVGAPYPDSDIEIVPIDGPTLEAFRVKTGAKRKGEVLDALLTVSRRPKVVLTNPDTLYLLAAMCYRDSQSAITRLSRYRTLVLDEFHLYSGIELARLLYLVHLLRFFGAPAGSPPRLIMLSATPRPEVLALLHEILPTVSEIWPEENLDGCEQSGWHTTVHSISFRIDSTDRQPAEPGGGLVENIVALLRSRRESARLVRGQSGTRAVPALAFVNSVVQAVRLERALLADGWLETELGSVRGLMSQTERRWQGKTVVVATAAGEVGIDFDCRLLIVEPTELGALIQRFGRAGRHAESDVVLIGQLGAPGIQGLRAELARRPTVMQRRDFLRLVASVFPASGAFADFSYSWEGVFAAASLTEQVLERVSKDYGADAEAMSRVRRALLEKEKSYFANWQARRGGAQPDLCRLHGGVRGDMRRALEGRSTACGWTKLYGENFPSFRAQALQATVYDQQEATRNRVPVYVADLRTLARFARLGTNHVIVPKLGLRIEVLGYENAARRYAVFLHRPDDWPQGASWPPAGLFWIGRKADSNTRIVTATLISENAGGRFPGAFPPGEDPVLALVMRRAFLDSLGFDWRLQAWPLRRMVGTAKDAESRVVLLGDQCLLAISRLAPDNI